MESSSNLKLLKLVKLNSQKRKVNFNICMYNKTKTYFQPLALRVDCSDHMDLPHNAPTYERRDP